MAAWAAYGVLVDDDLAGCFAIGAMRVPWADAYLATDFAVRPTEARHVAKLVLAAALSHEARLALQQSMNHLVRTLGTSAFTEKPVSAKYRGLFDLVKRDEAKDGRKVLHYRAATGRWSLADAYRWWYDKSYGENVNTITREAAV